MMLASFGSVTAPLEAQPLPSIDFAEPISGRKVERYYVDLPVGPSEYRTVTIPMDCSDVSQLIEEGAAYKGSIVDRRLWHKVEGDCRYHAFLNRHPMRDCEDHVSNYDFMNARIEDLPIDLGCAQAEAGECNPAATDALGMLRHFPLAEPVDALPNNGDQAQCELKDGLFRGRLFVDETGIHCEAGPSAPSLRLIAVDYADINGDRILDAVLRFVPIGRGAIRSPLVLPVTRTQPDGPFQVPDFRPSGGFPVDR